MNFIDIVFASLLANNLLFFHFLGLDEFLNAENSTKLFGRTLILAFALMAGAAGYWAGDHFVLQPFHLEFLRTFLVFSVLIVVLGLDSLVLGGVGGRSVPGPRELLVHSFLVGGILLVGSSSQDLQEVLAAAGAVALGYGGALVLLRSVFRRLDREPIPGFVQGLPLRLLTLGVTWLVLHGLGFAFVGKGS